MIRLSLSFPFGGEGEDDADGVISSDLIPNNGVRSEVRLGISVTLRETGGRGGAMCPPMPACTFLKQLPQGLEYP